MMNNISFLNLHQQVIQEKQLESLLKHEIERQRQAIDISIRKIISDLRSYSLLDIWYPVLTESCVLNFLKSSIYRREHRQVFESPDKLPFPKNKTLRLSIFLQIIPNKMDVVLECIHQYFLSSMLSEQLSYIPTSSPISFFASSTFPSLFGYNWCTEEGRNYIGALLKLIEMQFKQHGNSFLNSNFRNSYIREMVRQFYHASGVQRFLQLSLSKPIELLLADEKIANTEEGTLSYVELLLIYVSRINDAFLNSMPRMPALIKHFFSESYEFACKNCKKDPTEPKQLIEFLFFDLMISPALLNPKLFALIPETSISTRSPHLTMLTKIFRWKLMPSAIPDKYKAILDNEKYNSISAFSIIEKLTSFEDDLEGISGNLIMEVTETKYHLLLMSANDVQFLAHIINDTIDKIKCDEATRTEIKTAATIKDELNLEKDELLDFWYHKEDKLPNIQTERENLELVIPIIGSHQPISLQDPVRNTVSHLINYLQSFPPNVNCSNNSNNNQNENGSNQNNCNNSDTNIGIYSFLGNQLEIAKKNMSSEVITKTDAIKSKLKRLKLPENDILYSIHQLITEKLDSSADKFTASFKHQECLDDLKKLSKLVFRLNEQLWPIMHQSVLRVFFKEHREIQQFLTQNMSQLAEKRDEWFDFFTEKSQQLQLYGESLGLDSHHQMRLVRQLHSALVSDVPFKQFQTLNKSFSFGLQETDSKLVNNYEEILAKFQKDEYSKTLMQLFGAPSCFESATEVLRNGTKYGAPLEKLAKINEAMVVLQDIYLFEAGEGCPGDDFLPMFVFSLLNAKLPNLASLKVYIEHFLIGVSEKIKILDAKEKYVVTTFISAAEHIISFVTTNK